MYTHTYIYKYIYNLSDKQKCYPLNSLRNADTNPLE